MPDPSPPPSGSSPSSSGGERRHLTRRLALPKAFCYLSLSQGQALGPFPVENLSNGGLRLLVGSGFQTSGLQGSVTVQLHNRVRQRWEHHPAQVVYTEPLPSGQWGVGCTFLKHLADQEIQEFL
jgi:hypothetical protein